jgi:predicted DNA-binding ribbon-helix-helix protein
MSGKSSVTKILGVRLENDDKATLEALAEKRGVTMSKLVKELVLDFLADSGGGGDDVPDNQLRLEMG